MGRGPTLCGLTFYPNHMLVSFLVHRICMSMLCKRSGRGWAEGNWERSRALYCRAGQHTPIALTPASSRRFLSHSFRSTPFSPARCHLCIWQLVSKPPLICHMLCHSCSSSCTFLFSNNFSRFKCKPSDLHSGNLDSWSEFSSLLIF